MIKIINRRKTGALFHYAHFLCDCLFPEIINDIYKYKKVVREKSVNQTIGNFHKIYTDVMNIKNVELNSKLFNNLNIKKITYKHKEQYIQKKYFDKFRNFIFVRFKINPCVYDKSYPEIILIKRYNRIELISDEYLKKLNTNVTSGKERREIHDIDYIENHLKNMYPNPIQFKSLYLELISFEEQIKYFNNAKLIICAHGAAMSNMFFCKEKTKIIEVTCNKKWQFFDSISNILNLQHVKCVINQTDKIIECIDNNNIQYKQT